MPLRTLLGYEPSQSRKYDDYGGRFISTTPARSVIATKKAKYQAPMARLQKLPPIDEESTPASTPRLRQRHEGTRARITRLPKRAFTQIEDEDDNLKSILKPKPILSVRPIPREQVNRTADPPDKYDYAKLNNIQKKYVFQNRTGVYPNESPRNVNHSLVDGIVADYLHYARYGNVIPVYEGTSTAACPCCTNRNKENVRTLLGLPKHLAKQAPQKYDKQSKLNELKEMEDLDEDAKLFPNSLYSLERKKSKRSQELSPAEKQRQKVSTHSQKGSWMGYQPLPYASNYLNAEFNRPALTNDLMVAEAQRAHHMATDRILEANSNFDSAMNKLETLTFGGESYR